MLQGPFRCFDHVGGKGYSKCCPLARFAFDSDIPAHHLTKPSCDGETEPCAAVFASRGRIGLRECIEYPSYLIGRHSNPGIIHTKFNQLLTLPIVKAYKDANSPRFGE